MYLVIATLLKLQIDLRSSLKEIKWMSILEKCLRNKESSQGRRRGGGEIKAKILAKHRDFLICTILTESLCLEDRIKTNEIKP